MIYYKDKTRLAYSNDMLASVQHKKTTPPPVDVLYKLWHYSILKQQHDTNFNERTIGNEQTNKTITTICGRRPKPRQYSPRPHSTLVTVPLVEQNADTHQSTHRSTQVNANNNNQSNTLVKRKHKVDNRKNKASVSIPNEKKSAANSISLSNRTDNQKDFKMLTINCRGLRGKKSYLSVIINQQNPDIICGTESWLNGDVKSCEIFPDNYIVYRKDRPKNKDGGGVFILVKNNFVSVELPEFNTDCELLWVKVKSDEHRDMLVGTFYMPHRKEKDLEELTKSLSYIKKSNISEKQIILAGDFNCPNIDWDTYSLKTQCPDRKVQNMLIELATENELNQIHHEPTREDTILDLVFVSNQSLVKSSTSIPGICDHDAIITDLMIKPVYIQQKNRTYYQYSRANWTGIKNDIMAMTSTIENKYNSENTNTNELWDIFHSTIITSIEKNIPQKKKKSTTSLPWVTKSIKRILRRKSKLYKQAKASKNWTVYREYQRYSKQEMRKAEYQYTNNKILEGLKRNDTKPFWRYVKSKKSENIGVPPLKDKDDTLQNDSETKAKLLLDHFRSVFTPTEYNPKMPHVDANCQSTISNIKVTIEGVSKLLHNIDTSKAMGPDNIPNQVLKECADVIAPALTLIFQHSLDTGELPDIWLKANVSCVYKKGSKHNAENYRPISLTSVISKLLEHIICKNIMDHLENNKILTNLNHGFRSGFSCETQLIITTNDLLQLQNRGIQVDMGILDFSKAFDTVPHSKLLYKMKQYGVHGALHTWLRNFLTKRYMKVILEGTSSEEVPVTSGVPQGTVLGPLLFLCHINDLPNSVSSQVRLFADDSLIYRPIHSSHDHDILQKDLNDLEKWAQDWGMRFNANKCKILSIKKKSHFQYRLDNTFLEEIEKSPYLGLTLSNDLKWSHHISKITQKASSTIGFLRRNLRHCPEECRKNAYLSLVRPVMEYGAIIWDPYLQEDIKRLEKVQRRGVRFICAEYNTRTQGCVSRMIHQQNLPDLSDRRRILRLCFLYKIINGLIPSISPSEYLTPKRQMRRIRPRMYENHIADNFVTKFITNNDNCFNVPTSKTINYRNSFFIRTIIDWNALDDSTINSTSLDTFKSKIMSMSL